MRFCECNHLLSLQKFDTAASAAAELDESNKTSLVQKYVSVSGASTKKTCYLASMFYTFQTSDRLQNELKCVKRLNLCRANEVSEHSFIVSLSIRQCFFGDQIVSATK